MPHYEYACKDCGEHLEVVQSFKDEPLTECPACGGRLRKLFSAIGIQFNGPGFYRTDHRRRTPSESSSGSDKSSGDKSDKGDKADKGGAGKSDKPAAKSDSAGSSSSQKSGAAAS